MNTRPTPWSDGAWHTLLAESVTDIDVLLSMVGLSRDQAGLTPKADDAARSFRLRVPRSYVERMRRGDPKDPLLRQVLPVDAEEEIVSGFSVDPLGESSRQPDGGMLQKYRGRALVLTTSACAIHCRYCFRRHFPADLSRDPETALAMIQADPSIQEVILSGGDPLVLTDSRLESTIRGLAAIAHVQRIRLHTRLPIVLPQRVDGGLLRVLERCELEKVVVLHANHANEINDEVAAACSALAKAGATVLNQTVLMAGVNDSPVVLAELSERLFATGVLPYYLHLLDPVQGAAHFDLPEDRARRIFAELCARLPGYLVPRLVREVPGLPAKLVIAPEFEGIGREEDR